MTWPRTPVQRRVPGSDNTANGTSLAGNVQSVALHFTVPPSVSVGITLRNRIEAPPVSAVGKGTPAKVEKQSWLKSSFGAALPG